MTQDKLIDTIYKSAVLEGIKATKKDVEDVFNNINNGTLSIIDIMKLKGLKDAWQLVLTTIDEPLTIDYIKKVHLKSVKVKIFILLENFGVLV